jgi:hypothetical protein
MARAHANGVAPKDKYPSIPTSLEDEQVRLVAHLENGERSGDDAVVRGLARMSMSS